MGRTTQTGPPAWIDIDKMVPPDLRAQAEAAIEEVKALMPGVNRLVEGVSAIKKLVNTELDLFRFEGGFDTACQLTPLGELDDRVALLVGMLVAAVPGIADADSVAQLTERFGVTRGTEAPAPGSEAALDRALVEHIRTAEASLGAAVEAARPALEEAATVLVAVHSAVQDQIEGRGEAQMSCAVENAMLDGPLKVIRERMNALQDALDAHDQAHSDGLRSIWKRAGLLGSER